MEDKMNASKNLIIGSVVLIFILVSLWWYFSQKREIPAPVKTTEDIVKAVTAPEIKVESNPVGNKVPEVNPVDRVNPFKDAYKNPFE